MGGKSDGSVNRMFTLTDSFVVHMIRRYDILVRLERRGNLLAVLRRHVTEGSRWFGRREYRHDAGSKIDFKNLCESCLQST